MSKLFALSISCYLFSKQISIRHIFVFSFYLLYLLIYKTCNKLKNVIYLKIYIFRHKICKMHMSFFFFICSFMCIHNFRFSLVYVGKTTYITQGNRLISIHPSFMSFCQLQSGSHHRLPALHAPPQRMCIFCGLSIWGSREDHMGVWWERHSVSHFLPVLSLTVEIFMAVGR